MTVRMKTGLGMLLTVVIGILIIAKIIPILNPFVTCYPIKEARQLSPDNKRILTLVNQLCAGGVGISSDSYWITVHDSSRLGDNGIQVFYTWDYAPDVSWADSEHIVITILQVSQIRISPHQAGAVEIIYRLADNLLEENFRKKVNDYERRAIDAGESLTSNTNYPGALKNRVEFMWVQYRQLREWAAVNAVNGKL
jgi:hypothetical protein